MASSSESSPLAPMGNAGNFGTRLLPSILDKYAIDEPSRVYACLARSAEVAEGFEEISMRQLASAVDALAWRISNEMGDSKDFSTLAFFAPSDIRYPLMIFAAAKCQRKLLLLGPRNTVDQNLNLLQRAGCVRLVYGQEMARQAQHLRTKHVDLSIHELPPHHELVAQATIPYPFIKTFSSAWNDPVLMLHSSGTTGNPKLVTWTHGTLSVVDKDRSMPAPSGRRPQNGGLFDFPDGGRFYSCFPPYHLAGVIVTTLIPIFYGATVVFGPTSVPGSGSLVSRILDRISLRALYVPPVIIEQWMQEPNSCEQAKTLDFVLFGGGPLSQPTGDLLDRFCDVCQVYGSAEIGQVQLLVPEKGDWAYLEPNPFEEVDMQPYGKGVFELVLHQAEHLNHMRSLYYNFPHKGSWHTGDLFKPHISKPGLWSFSGRADDLILLSNGHKINPTAMENVVEEHPLISAAILIGQDKPQPILLLEVWDRGCELRRNELKDLLGPTVEKANDLFPQYGQVDWGMVLIAEPCKPFVRSPKGGVVRTATQKLYEPEIEALYSCALPEANGNGPWSLSDCIPSSLEQLIQKSLHQLLPGSLITLNDDIFVKGLDSLKATVLGAVIQRDLNAHDVFPPGSFSTNMIYRYPTVKTLAFQVYKSLYDSQKVQISDSARMQSLVESYTQDLTEHNCTRTFRYIILTGTTGSLGQHMLRTLLGYSDVATIYCLNRSTKAQKKAESLLQGRACDLSRAKFLHVNLSQPYLGLDQTTWECLVRNATIVIHTSWTVDFNLPLKHYEKEHLHGLRTLIELCIESRHRARLAFVSSSGAVSQWFSENPTHSIPELVPRSYSLAGSIGYWQSKLVAENILAIANEQYEIPLSILRVTQFAAATSAHGAERWPLQEWFPIMIQTSKTLDLVPTWDAYVDWIPVDTVAQIMCEIALQPVIEQRPRSGSLATSLGPKVYNVAHPYPIPWQRLAEAIQCRLGGTARVVPLRDWVAVLKQRKIYDLDEVAATPALKILPFFEALTVKTGGGEGLQGVLKTANGVAASSTMAGLRQLGDADIDNWLTQCQM